MPDANATYNSPINFIEVRHENGVISRLQGADADKWFQGIIQAVNVEKFYGYQFNVPPLQYVPTPRPTDARSIPELEGEPPSA